MRNEKKKGASLFASRVLCPVPLPLPLLEQNIKARNRGQLMLGFYPHQHVLKRRRWSLRDGWIIIEITAVEDGNGFAILLLLLL